MLSGKPLFPGRDYHHQLTLILDVLGTPTLDEFYAISTRRSRDYIRALPFRKRRPFATLFPNANPLAVDFLTKTLVCGILDEGEILFYFAEYHCFFFLSSDL
jgi:mitogen-activated protein kinase 1/3